jgi:predicted site-specific integrase-resolvase
VLRRPLEFALELARHYWPCFGSALTVRCNWTEASGGVLNVTGHKGQVVGYVRVSAADQNEARQVEALGEVDKMFSEKVSGKNTHDRAKLQEMLAYVRDGDKYA